MESLSYQRSRSRLEAYFDRTAADTWAQLTSDRPVSRIRRTVRQGRREMAEGILAMLPKDLRGHRILDAGCGTGALSVAAAQRGADVVAIDLSATLVELAQKRVPTQLGGGRIDFRVGDMLDPSLGDFDSVVAMDSLIHYSAEDMTAMVERLTARAKSRVVFTYAPRTPLLALMHWLGGFFPRADRAPFIQPIAARRLQKALEASPALETWRLSRSLHVSRGFYTSCAQELLRS
ncbi:MAG: magnesium protoporphyrin IX methyltransferase [Myxococcota bacterium]